MSPPSSGGGGTVTLLTSHAPAPARLGAGMLAGRLSCFLDNWKVTEHSLFFLAVKLAVKEEGSPGPVTGEAIDGSEASSCPSLPGCKLHGGDCPVTSNRAQHIVSAHETGVA